MDTLITWNEIILQIWKKAKAKKENQFKYIKMIYCHELKSQMKKNTTSWKIKTMKKLSLWSIWLKDAIPGKQTGSEAFALHKGTNDQKLWHTNTMEYLTKAFNIWSQ